MTEPFTPKDFSGAPKAESKPAPKAKPPAPKAQGEPETTTIVDAFTQAMPIAAAAINKILGVNIVEWAPKPNGGVVVITGQGQKFTFTAEEIESPALAKQRLKHDKLKVFKSLPHGPVRIPRPEPEDE